MRLEQWYALRIECLSSRFKEGAKTLALICNFVNYLRVTELKFNVILLLFGSRGVGKTCIMKQWLSKQFTQEYILTKQGSDQKDVIVNSRIVVIYQTLDNFHKKNCHIDLIDTAGLAQSWGMCDQLIHLHQADRIMIAYLKTDEASFEFVSELEQQVSRNIHPESCCIMVGNNRTLRIRLSRVTTRLIILQKSTILRILITV